MSIFRFPSARSFVFAVVMAATVVPAVAASSVVPRELTCEYRINPLGLGETAPRLAWRVEGLNARARGLAQSAWQVMVASTREELEANRADRWDSGKVAGGETNAIVYHGQPLASREICWWKVRVWDQAGRVSAWSEPAKWTMGLLDPKEFSAEWIGLDLPAPADGLVPTEAQKQRLKQIAWVQAAVTESKTAPVTVGIRGGFTVPAGRILTRATLLLLTDMRCEITLNGQRMGTTTRWDRAMCLDLAPALLPGDNIVGLKVTQDDGYAPAVRGEIELVFTEGEPLRVPVDASWRATTELPPGWDQAGCSTETWRPVVALVSPTNPKDLKASPWGTPDNSLHWLAPAPFLRTTFKVEKKVRRATVYATAFGLYELHLNGARVGGDYLTPGWTEYRKRLHYQTYDVTAQVHRGTNAIGAILGDGWFAGLAAYTGQRRYYGGEPRLRAQLEIEYVDGTRATVSTNGHWRGAAGPIRYADLYLGCAYDSRMAQPDWAKPFFVAKDWQPVVTGLALGSPENVQVEAATIEPVRVAEELPGRKVTEPRPGTYVVDFGQNMVGWVRLKVTGKAGQKITLRHGEMLNPNGTLYTSNLRGATATDVFWLRGGDETLEPWGTFHGFRYVEITGLDSRPEASAATGRVIHNAMTRTGDFSSSSPLVNQLFHNIVWGQKGNYLEAPTDCPQRDERAGWTGDTQFFIRTGLYNFQAVNFIERWLTTMIDDSQGEDGTFPSTVPAVKHKPEAVTAWGDAAIVCTHALWQVYGDTRPIERHFDRLARYIAMLQKRAKDDIVSIGGYGDWLNKGGGAKKEVIDTAYYAYLCGLMAEMAGAIGRTEDAAHYAALQREVAAAWQHAFLLPDGGILESSQTGFALGFTMGLIPDDAKARVADKFVADIAAKDWHLATGFIGTPRLLPALHLAGRDDVAYRLLLQETYPSWLLPVKLGATTMWERWDGWTPEGGFQSIGMNSFNHYAFGAVGEYLYRQVAGIDTDGAGFRHLVIAPLPGPGLTSARASYDAITGRIESSWKITDGKFSLEVAIPPNTIATVRVPVTAEAVISESGRPLQKAEGVVLLRADPSEIVLRVGSGNYRFTVGK